MSRFAFCRNGQKANMRVAGADLRPGAVADLATRLHRAGHEDLAGRVGNAVDLNRTEVYLTTADRAVVLRLLIAECPDALGHLRDRLQAAA
jgi:hypothetical protein